MRRLTRLAIGAGAVLGLSAWVAPFAAGAEGLPPGPHVGGDGNHVVFVQTDNTTGNQVVAYDRAATDSSPSQAPTTQVDLAERAERIGGRPPRIPRIPRLRPAPTPCSTP